MSAATRKKVKRIAKPLKVDLRGEDGRYRFSKMARMCVCGHALGAHAAARRKSPTDGRTYQHCFAGQESEAPCECACFDPATGGGR